VPTVLRRAPFGPLPDSACREISYLAARYVRALAPKGAHRGSHGFWFVRPTWRRGEVGVWIGPGGAHLMHQSRGIRPFIMWSLEGKTIPMRQPDGSVIFRKATRVGQRRIVTRDARGRIIRPGIRWRHPGLPRRDFIERGIEMGVREWVSRKTPQEVANLLGQAVRR
jgi:hypothetical protein